MSVSQHPIALRLERQVGGATKLLATVMGLPLIDGIFPALVIAGALSTPADILEAGLLIFGGSATVAVILAEMDGTRREQAASVLLIGAVLIPVAVMEAAIAESLASVLDFKLFTRFAGLVILAIAAKTASAEIGEYLPSPGVIIALGLLASFEPSGGAFVVDPDVTKLLHAAAAAGVGVAFALAVTLAGPKLREVVALDRFRFGSAVALGMLAIDILGLMPYKGPVALGVLVVTALFAFDPENAAGAVEEDDSPDDPDADWLSADSGPSGDASESGVVADGSGGAVDSADQEQSVVDRAVEAAEAATEQAADVANPGSDPDDDGDETREHPPWL